MELTAPPAAPKFRVLVHYRSDESPAEWWLDFIPQIGWWIPDPDGDGSRLVKGISWSGSHFDVFLE